MSLILMAAPGAASEVQRTVRAELSGADVAAFRVENLVGRMRITTGSADRVTVVATVYAEDSALADAVRIERVSSAGSGATLRVRYPYDRVSTFRYRAPGDDSGWSFLDSSSSDHYGYDDHQVRVSRSRGTKLHADLEIQVPAGSLRAAFRNLAGRIEADGLKGSLHFEVESADLGLRRLDGDIEVEGSSGDVLASDLRGRWKSKLESGDCRIDGFEGESLSFHAASGDVAVRRVRARRFESETASGDVRVTSADLEDFQAEAASGDIALTVDGSRLASVRIETASGDVSLGLPASEAFDAVADQSSGDMYVKFDGGTAVHDGESLVRYRHGDGGAQIRVTTASGDFSISPL